MSEPKKITFKEFVTLQRGFDLPKRDMKPGMYPVIGSTSIIGYHDKFKLDPPGVVIGRSGALGSVQYIAVKYWPHNTSLWIKNFKGNFPRYVYYCLQTLGLQQFNSGAAVPTLNRNNLDTLELKIHDLPTQRKIAAALNAYDNLIENNTRRIAILEKMASAIYREWFVEFRFPGHEGVERGESELGLIPQGWEVKSFGEVCFNFDRQRKPLSGMVRSTMQGEYPYYGAAKILDHINGYLFDGRYLLIAEDGSVITEDGKPVLQLVTGKFWVNNHAHVVQGKTPISTNFLYLFMSNVAISGYITGAAQPKINQDNLNRIPILSPSQGVLERFDKMIGPIFDNIATLGLKNNNLRQTRDLLLPKLISGEIDVSDLDIDTD